MTRPSILVTGANSGIGNATARYFLERDPSCHVFLGTRTNTDGCDALAAEFPGRCVAIRLDVSDPAEWTTALSEIEALGRTVTVLVNNAGHHEDHLLATMPPEAWFSVIRSNLDSAFFGSRAVIRGMMGEKFGRIVNIASLSALLAPPGQANYAAAKAGVVAMTQSLAKEVARMGITANTVCPGYIETAALGDMDPEQKKARKMVIPMRRFGKPEEVAAAVFFLASKEASYITGATLKIDGGIF